MQYIALIYFPEEGRDAIQPRMWQEYGAFTQEMIAKGYFKAGDALAPTSAATTVQVRDGKTHIKDGPYAETKEQLGGFYIFECKDLDEALSLAARVPDASNGVIELRPIAEHPLE